MSLLLIITQDIHGSFPLSLNLMFLLFLASSYLTLNDHNLKLLTLQIDRGGKFKSLTPICKKNWHHTLYVMLSHSSIKQTCWEKASTYCRNKLVLLAYASLPFTYWVKAFKIAAHLINMLSSPTIHNQTPHFKVYNCESDYKFLKVFSCKYWPNIRLYLSYKLHFRSVSCLFLGYSPSYKGYQHLDLQTNRLYISRDVQFNEASFPLYRDRPKSLPSNHSKIMPFYFLLNLIFSGLLHN